MKVGRTPATDLDRVRAARKAIGARTELFVDANGAYARKQALDFAQAFHAEGVTWFEEPVRTSDWEGFRFVRDRAPASLEIAGGEYGYDLAEFEKLLSAGTIDVLQADITRCAGLTEFLRVAALAEARGMPLSAHTAPSMHLHVGCAVRPLRHLEYFHDHVRIEGMFFDGVARPVEGKLHPDLDRPGHGLEFREADAKRFEVLH